MEELLHYVWKHKLFPLKELRTTNGMSVEVVDPGLHNHNAGADFFNAKIKLGGTLWVGNVELHERASQWYEHRHHLDETYNNVVLHVVETADTEVRTLGGTVVPQLVLAVPERVSEQYESLLHADRYPPCYDVVARLDTFTLHGWLNRLQTERLEEKTNSLLQRLERCRGDWESAFFITLARNYGFGTNGDAFEQWASTLPLSAVGHHRDNLFQVEAFFMGTAGLLDDSPMLQRHCADTPGDDYKERLTNEWKYLQRKFDLEAIPAGMWRFLRLRPQNFPYIRMAQLAFLYHHRNASVAQLLDCTTPDDVFRCLSAKVTPYWETHYAFGKSSAQSEKHLSKASLRLLAINTVAPLFFAYGTHRNDEKLRNNAIELLEKLKAEDNHIVRMWAECGISAQHAGDSQALIHLKTAYCDKKNCLRCRIGYELLSQKQKETSSTNKP